jgi:hypothetical protein
VDRKMIFDNAKTRIEILKDSLGFIYIEKILKDDPDFD